MQTRIYVVTQRDKPNRLVEASSAAQAIRHCVRGEYSAKVPTNKELAAAMTHGLIIEKANEDEASNKLTKE